MAYVYKYVDKNDGIVKYVGIIKNETNFPKRFRQHERDWWFDQGDWDIFYIETLSVTDAEVLEAHFIELYGTGEYFNKAKTGWGLCSFVQDNHLEWTKVESWHYPYLPSRKSTYEFVLEVQRELMIYEDEFHRLSRIVADYRKDLTKFQRASIRLWFSAKGEEELRKKQHVSIEEAYESYCGFKNEFEFDEQLFDFVDMEEFWEEMPCNYATENYCYKDHLTVNRKECKERFYENGINKQ